MNIIFWILTGIVLLCALGVIISRSPIHSGISLLIGFVSLAGLYLLLKAEFVAAVQVLVYAGGIIVLYLFAIMLTDIEVLNIKRQIQKQGFIALILVVILFGFIGNKLSHSRWDILPAISIATASSPEEEKIAAIKLSESANNTKAIAPILYRDFLYPFEIASILLLLSVVGAIYLTKRETA